MPEKIRMRIILFLFLIFSSVSAGYSEQVYASETRIDKIKINNKELSIPIPPEMRVIPNEPAQNIKVLYQAVLDYDARKLESENIEIHPTFASVVCDISQPDWIQGLLVTPDLFDLFKQRVRASLANARTMTAKADELIPHTPLSDYVMTISDNGPFAESDTAIYASEKTVGRRTDAEPDYYHLRKHAFVLLNNTIIRVRIAQKKTQDIPEVEEKKLEHALVAWVKAIEIANSAPLKLISRDRLATLGWNNKTIPICGVNVFIPIPNEYEMIKPESSETLIEFVSRDFGLDKMRSGMVIDFPYHRLKNRTDAYVSRDDFRSLIQAMIEMSKEPGQVMLLLNETAGAIGKSIKVDKGKYLFRSKTFVHIKDRILWLQTDSSDNPENRQWAASFLKEWTNAIIAANQNTPFNHVKNISLGRESVSIPILRGFKEDTALARQMEIPGMGQVNTHLAYINRIGSGRNLVVTHISVFSYDRFDSQDITTQDFAGFKASSKTGMKFFKDEYIKLMRQLGLRGNIEKIGAFAEGEDFIAGFSLSAIKQGEYDLFQYTTNAMLHIKDKIIEINLNITTEFYDESFATSAQEEILEWTNAIIAANK